jgi:menaquinone-dependent protoporphyrinogen oxidase
MKAQPTKKQSVLIAVASKHGSTVGIGEAIADELRQKGLQAVCVGISEVPDLGQYDAYVIGSAIYAGHWLKSARQFVLDNVDTLQTKPSWLFSSGAIGDPPRPSDEQVDQIDEFMVRTASIDHRIFDGSLAEDKLDIAERLLIKTLRVTYGDYRKWDQIKSWADDIASHLLPS